MRPRKGEPVRNCLRDPCGIVGGPVRNCHSCLTLSLLSSLRREVSTLSAVEYHVNRVSEEIGSSAIDHLDVCIVEWRKGRLQCQNYENSVKQRKPLP